MAEAYNRWSRARRFEKVFTMPKQGKLSIQLLLPTQEDWVPEALHIWEKDWEYLIKPVSAFDITYHNLIHVKYGSNM